MLRELDVAIVRRNLVRGISTLAKQRFTSKVADYLSFNDFERVIRPRLQHIADRTVSVHTSILDKVREVPLQQLKTTHFSQLLHSELIAIQTQVPITALHPSIDDIAARIQAMQALDFRMLDQLFFMLTIVEEAISHASARGAETGDLLSF